MSKETDLSLIHEASLRNKVSKYIKAQIITGQYRPGESLIESKLAEELGVSRTPIREAIRLLEVEGLIETTPNKGAVVLGITAKDVEDIYAIRQLVEGLAGRWAAMNMSPHDKKELQKINELMEFYAAKGDIDEVATLDNHFHEMIYQASGSKILNLTLSNLHQYVQLARLESLKVPNRLPETLAEHKALMESFLQGNPQKAEETANIHAHNAYMNIKNKGQQLK